MKKKLVTIGGILVIIFVVAVIFIFSYDNKDNTSNEVSNVKDMEDKDVNGIVFTNITADFNGSVSILEYSIINKTSEVINLGEYEIVVKDKDGMVIANITCYLDQDIAPNEEVKNGNSIDIDLTKADSIELVLE